MEAEARFDGKFVLRTNTELQSAEVALQYKCLLLLEQFFRAVKSMLDSRPVFHQEDHRIRGHVFCSFLALLLYHELEKRIKKQGEHLEWYAICQNLESLSAVEVRERDQWYFLRTALQGVSGKFLRAVGIAVPLPVKLMENVVPKN